jgi:hypothetical protein
MATTSVITGRFVLPNNVAATDAVVRFVLSGFDTDQTDDDVIAPYERVVTLEADGDLPPGVVLWRNERGIRTTRYQVFITVTTADAFGGMAQRAERSLGFIQIGSAPTYDIADLLDQAAGPFEAGAVIYPTLAAAVEAAVDAAAAGADPIAAIAARDAAEDAQAAAEAAAAGINSRHVADLPALRALNTTQFKAATIGLSGSVRLFNSTNLTSQIAAGDPRYTPPNSDPTGASGAWALRSDIFADADDLGVVTGTVSDAVALTNAQRINAWLAGADGRVFDWRADLIGIGQTARLGRDGNGILGVSGQPVFGGASAGARARWQGAAAGTMVRVAHNTTTADVDSPSIFGLALDGNGLARFGYDLQGYFKMKADGLHVHNLQNSTASWAYRFRDNPDATGGQVNCPYGGEFGRLTAAVTGDASGFLFTGRIAPGTAATMNVFGYIHVTCQNGYALFAEKGDTNTFHQFSVSRAAGNTTAWGGSVYMRSDIANLRGWWGNRINNMNLSKTGGDPIQLTFDGTDVRGNMIVYNCVDFAPEEVFASGATPSQNKIVRLGQPNYAGGWTVRPRENLFPLRNEDDADPLVLDHYSETAPTFGFAFGGNSVGMTYGLRSSKVTRIGAAVTVSGSITLTARGTSTGVATITGLPFGSVVIGAMSVSFYQNLASSFASPPMGAVGSTGVITLRKAGGASAVDMTHADFTDTTRIDFSVTYQVA